MVMTSQTDGRTNVALVLQMPQAPLCKINLTISSAGAGASAGAIVSAGAGENIKRITSLMRFNASPATPVQN